MLPQVETEGPRPTPRAVTEQGGTQPLCLSFLCGPNRGPVSLPRAGSGSCRGLVPQGRAVTGARYVGFCARPAHRDTASRSAPGCTARAVISPWAVGPAAPRSRRPWVCGTVPGGGGRRGCRGSWRLLQGLTLPEKGISGPLLPERWSGKPGIPQPQVAVLTGSH